MTNQVMILVMLAAGCFAGAEPELGNTSQASELHNGTSLNGTSLNGTSLNGTSLNGTSLNGTSLNGTSLNGTSLNGTSLNGTSLNGTSLNGSTWTGTTSNGETVQMRIDASYTGTGANSDIGMYAVAYLNEDGWQPLCGLDGDGTPILAIAVAGIWNLTTGAYHGSGSEFTWACRGKTIAKCVELGYKTWLERIPHLLACVRLLRADYCGDGVSWTVDGSIVDLYDDLGVQAMTQPAWIPEAEWTPSGARCVSDRAAARFTNLGLPKPSCLRGGRIDVTASCGASFAVGAFLIDRLPEAAFGSSGTSGGGGISGAATMTGTAGASKK